MGLEFSGFAQEDLPRLGALLTRLASSEAILVELKKEQVLVPISNSCGEAMNTCGN
jgi:hypothetical protein